MRLVALLTTTVLSLAVAAVTTTPAHAASTMTIRVSPTSLKPGETATVTGETSGPACASDGVTVTLSYSAPDGTNGVASQSATTDAGGEFTVSLAVPDDAVAGEPASVSALIPSCAADDDSAVTSNVVTITVTAHDGTLEITDGSGASASSGESGELVRIAGANCYGDDVVVLFTNGDDSEEVTVFLEPDRTFSGEYVLPDAPGGSYEFVAQCPGTDFPVRAFQLRNEEPAQPLPPRPVAGGPDDDEPGQAPPARPVEGVATFTG